MSHTVCRHRRLALALALGGLALAAPRAAAQSPALYALNTNGTLSVNDALLDTLSGSKWVSIVVDGSDRYALRDDGLVFKNGVKLYKIVCKDGNGDNVDEGNWVGLTFNTGSLWALSQFGYLAQDGICVVKFDPGLFVYSTIFSGASGIYSMRTDGVVNRNTTTTPVYDFLAGPGAVSGAGEGEELDTVWQTGIVGPDGKAYALRRDGHVVRGDLFSISGADGDPANGTVIATLPMGTTATTSTLYADLVFTVDGSWNVLRGNGDLYQEPNQLSALIELNDGGTVFTDLLALPVSVEAGTTDVSWMALRKDGNLFRETGVASIGKLIKSSYGQLALSGSAPDLANVTNTLPVVAKYTVQAVSGESVTFPILATDVDLTAEDLVVTVDETTLPAGAVFDDVARTITWADPVKGSFKVKVQVSDGVGNPVKVTYAINVKDPDTNVDKNFAPRVSKIKNVQALVGFELALPILATDVDGDALTISVDEAAEPFTLGATFDPITNVFTWEDPSLADIGSYKVQFSVTDGIKTVKLTVTIKVVANLLTF